MEKSSLPDDTASAHRLLWDCTSSLYDSFELTSFEHHLASAIAASSRTFSMPHLSNPRLPPSRPIKTSSASRIASVLRKLVRSVLFGCRRKREIRNFGIVSQERRCVAEAGFYYVFYDKSGTLSTIPEGSEWEGMPETTPLVRKTASERYTASTTTSVGIY